MSGDKLRVWLDDRPERDPPVEEGWTVVRTPDEVIALLETGRVEELSLDHDLALWDSEGREQTGDDVVTWLQGAVVTRGFEPPDKIVVHSGNPPGRRKMELGIEAVYRHYDDRAAEAARRGRSTGRSGDSSRRGLG